MKIKITLSKFLLDTVKEHLEDEFNMQLLNDLPNGEETIDREFNFLKDAIVVLDAFYFTVAEIFKHFKHESFLYEANEFYHCASLYASAVSYARYGEYGMNVDSEMVWKGVILSLASIEDDELLELFAKKMKENLT